MFDNDKTIYILDFETTGTLEKGTFPRVTEIGLVNLIDRNKTYQRYINPEENLTDFIVKYTGITNELLSDKPIFKDIAKELIEFLSGKQATLAAWPISFELPILQYEFAKAGYDRFPLDRRAIDIGTLACRYLCKNNIKLLKNPNSKDKGDNPTLDNVSYSLGIEQEGKRHSALGDAQLEAAVLKRVLE